jgi:hypothetical protein
MSSAAQHIYEEPRLYRKNIYGEDTTISQSRGYLVLESSPSLADAQISRNAYDEGAHIKWMRPSAFQNSINSALQKTINRIVDFQDAQETIAQRAEIKKLIDRFVGDDSIFAPNIISHEVADASKKLLDLLPFDSKLPKVEADGEGAMMFLWTKQRKHLFAIVEADRIHLAIDATTPATDYVIDLPFDGTALPIRLAELLPG